MDFPFQWPELIWNIIVNMISSFLFLFIVLWVLKPKLRIAPFICKYQSPYPGEGEMYFLKVVNTSYFSAYDIRAELLQIRRVSVPPKASSNRRLTTLTLKKSNLTYIPNFVPGWLRKEAVHCMILRTDEDLQKILSDDGNTIEFHLTLKHGLTGLTKLYKHEYCDSTEIKMARYSYGTRFGIM